MKRLVLIDANSLLHRAYHALPSLTTRQGEAVGAVFGFASMLLKVWQELKPDFMAVAWDTPKPTFRHERYTAYKAQRPETPEDLEAQGERTKKLVEAFGIPQFSQEGYEADDIIGTLTVQASQKDKDLQVVIVTGDLDTLQLVNKQAQVYTSRRNFGDTILYDVQKVKERYGLDPRQLVDLRALRGDPSDNIPGVKGIGEKTATLLLQQFDNLTAIYKQLNQLSDRQAKLLRAGKEKALLSQDLAQIRLDVPVSLNLQKCHLDNYDQAKVLQLFQELDFRSLVNRLPSSRTTLGSKVGQGDKASLPVPSGKYYLVQSDEDWEGLVQELEKPGPVALDSETTTLDPLTADLIGLSLSTQVGKGWFVPARLLSKKKSHLERLLSKKTLIAHNLKYDFQVLKHHGWELPTTNIFDTLLAAYLLQGGGGNLGLKELTFNLLGEYLASIEEIPGIKINLGEGKVDWSQVQLTDLTRYACADADYTYQLFGKLLAQLQASENQKIGQLLNRVELPLIKVLMRMEENGVLIDQKALRKLHAQLEDKSAKAQQGFFGEVGRKINLNSPQQLETVLFDELKLPVIKKTKTQRSTDESVLRKLLPLHPSIKHLLSYRELFKIKSTYVDALLELTKQSPRVHTHFNQTRTATGRLSSERPNLQNIPVSQEIPVRRVFVAEAGHLLLVADYSQIELRIVAHLSQDENLLESFKHDQDIHTATAARVFAKYLNEVNKEERQIGKTINFAVLYGMSAYSLSQMLEVEFIRAQAYINEYFSNYPKVKEWIEKTLEKTRQLQRSETVLGRWRFLPEINADTRVKRAAAERMAINHPVQGTAADMIKKAMVEIDEKILAREKGVKMVLQVHDELVFEMPKEKVEKLGPAIKKVMEESLALRVPIEVDLKVGENWQDLQPIG